MFPSLARIADDKAFQDIVVGVVARIVEAEDGKTIQVAGWHHVQLISCPVGFGPWNEAIVQGALGLWETLSSDLTDPEIIKSCIATAKKRWLSHNSWNAFVKSVSKLLATVLWKTVLMPRPV